ncbi:hypothetical protein F5Y09DRAFT_343983 [Xylaria sp. FL1042]|nr:hypothetical protein F5Y09DRAFT_343983 [Xylaria sp. FL1042]
MDPASILGLVANIVQFVSFSYDILTTVHELNSGGSSQVEQLKLLVHDVRRSHREMSEFLKEEGNPRMLRHQQSRQQGGSNEQELKPLRSIADECDKIARELLRHLNRFEMKKSGWQRKLEVIKVSG